MGLLEERDSSQCFGNIVIPSVEGTLSGQGLPGKDGSNAGAGRQAPYGPKCPVPSQCEY